MKSKLIIVVLCTLFAGCSLLSGCRSKDNPPAEVEGQEFTPPEIDLGEIE
jgi:hypothetical protein|tara:strand:+ start:33 stop:182 length:150 start_codon:yes stop_codon:yes gene_type:complete